MIELLYNTLCFVYGGILFSLKMDGRKRLSGAAYKKLAKEKAEREEEVLSKIPKLNQFFKPKPTKSHALGPEVEVVPTSSDESVEVEGRYLNSPTPKKKFPANFTTLSIVYF